MPKFTYSAKSPAGERVEGTVESNDRRGALRQIERLGYVPISIREGEGPTPVAAPAQARES